MLHQVGISLDVFCSMWARDEPVPDSGCFWFLETKKTRRMYDCMVVVWFFLVCIFTQTKKQKTWMISTFKTPVQFLRLVKSPKRILRFKIVDVFSNTQDKISPQLLKSLVVSMPERVVEVNRENQSLHYMSRPCYLKKNWYQMISPEFQTMVL